MGVRIAEYVLATILAQAQQTRLLDRCQQGKQWFRHVPSEIAGTKALILGAGRIGQAIGSLLKACSVETHATARTTRSSDLFTSVLPTSEALRRNWDANWLIAALPLTRNTRDLIDFEFLSQLDDAFFVNVGRGETLVDDDLLHALEVGHVNGAALDVFRQEPLPSHSPFWSHSKISVTPHIAGITRTDDIVEDFISVRTALMKGRRSSLAVDPVRGY